MFIQYYGDCCFKITAKPGGRATDDVVLWTDPVSKDSGLRSVQGQADIVLLSHDTLDRERLGSLRGEPIVFDMPGEYASHGFTLHGIPSFRDTENGTDRGQNTIFTFTVEDISVCFLGALGHPLSTDQLSKIGRVDILFIPVGNTDTLAIGSTDELIRKIEPALVVPMHYKMDGLRTELADKAAFCKEIGNCPDTEISKLAVKRKDLEGKSMEVVLFERG